MRTTVKRVSASEYGRQRGVSHVAVLKAIKDGRIPARAGKINPREADEALAAHRETYSAAIRRKESARASLLELELAVKRGDLVDIHTVAQVQSEVNSNIKSKLLSLPGKLAQRLTGLQATREIEEMLKDEIYECLTELSQGKY